MISQGGSYIKKNGKLELVERTEWPKEEDALVQPSEPEAAQADTPPGGSGKPNSGKKDV